jgi:hypothetical protein
MSLSRPTCLRAALVLSLTSVTIAAAASAQTQPGYSPIVDFNGDGYADIAEHHTASGNFYVRLNLQNGTFQAPGTFWGSGTTSAPSPTWQVLVGEFSGSNTFADYLDIHRPSGQVWVHDGNGAGWFNPSGVFLGTISTDPNVEFLVAPRGPGFFPRTALLFEHNRATGSLYARYGGTMAGIAFSNYTTQTGSDWRVAFCDFNGDSKSDLVEYHIPSAQVWVHLSGDPAGIWFDPNFAIHWTAFANASFTTVFGDYNNDNKCDYGDVNRSTGEIWVHLNNGNGTFNGANYAYGIYTPNVGFSIMGLPVSLP